MEQIPKYLLTQGDIKTVAWGLRKRAANFSATVAAEQKRHQPVLDRMTSRVNAPIDYQIDFTSWYSKIVNMSSSIFLPEVVVTPFDIEFNRIGLIKNIDDYIRMGNYHFNYQFLQAQYQQNGLNYNVGVAAINLDNHDYQCLKSVKKMGKEVLNCLSSIAVLQNHDMLHALIPLAGEIYVNHANDDIGLYPNTSEFSSKIKRGIAHNSKEVTPIRLWSGKLRRLFYNAEAFFVMLHRKNLDDSLGISVPDTARKMFNEFLKLLVLGKTEKTLSPRMIEYTTWVYLLNMVNVLTHEEFKQISVECVKDSDLQDIIRLELLITSACERNDHYGLSSSRRTLADSVKIADELAVDYFAAISQMTNKELAA